MTSDVTAAVAMDKIWFRCDSDECDAVARIRLEWRVPRGTLPTPRSCVACSSPMRLGGRVRLHQCSNCYDRGWRPEMVGTPDQFGVQDEREVYCECPAGARLRDSEG